MKPYYIRRRKRIDHVVVRFCLIAILVAILAAGLSTLAWVIGA
jgi:hypothetical protein